MQLVERMNTKSCVQQIMQHLSLSRGVGAIVRDVEEAALFRQRVRSDVFSNDYTFFGEQIHIHINFQTHILTIQYHWGKQKIYIKNIHELGAYVGNWLRDNLISNIYHWSWYLQKEVENHDSNSAKKS